MKERLVGAAVLVAIGAWLIPWVLDGPEQIGRSERRSLDLPVPSAENPAVRTETVVLQRRESPVASPSTPERPESEGGSDTTSPRANATPVRAEPAPAQPPEPAVETATVAAGPASAAETEWFVQLGAFGEEDNAERQAARIGTFGFDAHVSAFPSGSGVVHRVRVGPQATRERAEAIASSLSAHGFVAQVVFE